MITDILTLTPDFNLKESISFQTDITEAETGDEERLATLDEGLREYKLTVSYLTAVQMQTIWDFYVARQGSTDDFLLKILTEFQATDEPVGTGDGVSTSFLLDHFPVDTTANNSSKLDGIATTAYTLTNDFVNEKSYIQFTSAPALGAVITATYEYYFRMRFKNDNFTRELMNHNLLNAGIEFVEVRWNTYFPFAGNSSSSSSSSSAGGTTTRWYAMSGHIRTIDALASQYTQGNSTQVYGSFLVRNYFAQVTTQFWIGRMMIYLDTAPGLGKKRVFTLYHNDQPTTLTCTIKDNQKTGDVNGNIFCDNGDYVYVREDLVNSPATSNVNLGFSLRTNDSHRCPVISYGSTHTINGYEPLFDNSYSGGSFFYNPAGDAQLNYHSLITTPGYLKNLQLRAPSRLARDGQGGIPNDLVKICKKIGTDKNGFVETGLQPDGSPPQGLKANLLATDNMPIRAEDQTVEETIITRTGFFSFESQDISYRKSCRIENGDMVVVKHESSSFIFNYARMVSMDFIPDNPKESNHGKSNYGNNTQVPDTSGDKFDTIHGSSNFLRANQRNESFTLFAVAGTIKNFTIGCKNFVYQPGFPLVYTIRKNGVDTNLVFTLSNVQQQVTLPGTLHVNVRDRISIKVNQAGTNNPLGGSGDFIFGWTFKSDNAGEWPVFSSVDAS